MRKKLLLAALTLCGIFALTGCQTLPEGSQRPDLAISHVSLASGEAAPGFDVECTLRHDSLQPLPLQQTEITVFINGTKAAELIQPAPQDEMLPPNQDLKLSYKVPANLLPPAAAYSLTYNRMLKLPVSVLVHLTFTEAEQALSFNPNATFEGIISHD